MRPKLRPKLMRPDGGPTLYGKYRLWKWRRSRLPQRTDQPAMLADDEEDARFLEVTGPGPPLPNCACELLPGDHYGAQCAVVARLLSLEAAIIKIRCVAIHPGLTDVTARTLIKNTARQASAL